METIRTVVSVKGHVCLPYPIVRVSVTLCKMASDAEVWQTVSGFGPAANIVTATVQAFEWPYLGFSKSFHSKVAIEEHHINYCHLRLPFQAKVPRSSFTHLGKYDVAEPTVDKLRGLVTTTQLRARKQKAAFSVRSKHGMKCRCTKARFTSSFDLATCEMQRALFVRGTRKL